MKKFLDLTTMLTHCPLRKVYAIKVDLDNMTISPSEWHFVLENIHTRIDLSLTQNNNFELISIVGKEVSDAELSDVKEMLREHLNFRFIQYLVKSMS